jgi:hypothetical protein
MFLISRIFGCVAYAHVPEEMRRKLDDRSERCIFVGYSEESRAYRLYNPITKKYVINRDVQFKEEEAWDGSIDKSVSEGVVLPHEDDDGAEQAEGGGQLVPHAHMPAARSPTREAPVFNPSQFRMPRTHERGEPSGHGGHQTDSQVSSESNPTLASLKNRFKGQKTRSLRELYDQNEEVDQISNFSLMACDPVSFNEAAKEDVWIKAMDEEIDSIERNNTWDLVDLPEGKKSIGVKWVYKTKLNAEGEVEKYKARLVAQGFSQQPGIDYNETFSPVARIDTVRMVLAIAAQNKWIMHQMDVKSAFLNGCLEEEVYVRQPLGYEIDKHRDKVYKLRKALYGLKQASRVWYSRIDEYLISVGFNRSPSEPTLYTKVNQEGKILIVCLYVDDLIFTGDLSVDDFKNAMKTEFEMTDLGLMKYFLGIEVDQSDDGIFICQTKYANEVLKRFRMLNCKPSCNTNGNWY